MTNKSNTMLAMIDANLEDTEHINKINYIIAQSGYPDFQARRNIIRWLITCGFIARVEKEQFKFNISHDKIKDFLTRQDL